MERLASRESENYWRPMAYNFIMLGEQNSLQEFENAFPDFYVKYMAEFGDFLKAEFRLITTPLADLHFTPNYSYDLPKGNRSYHYLLITAGIFLLLIALLNYSNMLSASMSARTHSLGIFKVNGALKSHLYGMLITESYLILILATLIAWFLLSAVEPYFNNWLDGALVSSPWETGTLLLMTLLFVGISSLAFLLSVSSKIYRQPLNLLRGNPLPGSFNHPFRVGKVSIILQFTLAAILIISSLLIDHQVKYLLRAETGYDSENIVQIKLHAPNLPVERIWTFKEELAKSPMIGGAAYSSNIPGETLGTSHFKIDVDGTEASKIVSLLGIDADYIPLMNMEFREGRNFKTGNPGAPNSGIILNEAGVDFMGLGDSLAGKYIRNIEILGVLKNGHYNSLQDDSRPIAFYYETGNRGYMNVKIVSEDLPGAMNFIKKTYETFFTQLPFESTFMDETVEAMYRNDINQSNLLGVFTALSIILANIGLFGLVATINRKRIKEIGIRKVNGAQKSQLVVLLGKQLILWILIALIVAVPVTWYMIKIWQQGFANRAPFAWWTIPLGGLIILISGVITTLWITLRAANRNPVDTLRYE
jgi:putative ABC transport system permease protein